MYVFGHNVYHRCSLALFLSNTQGYPSYTHVTLYRVSMCVSALLQRSVSTSSEFMGLNFCSSVSFRMCVGYIYCTHMHFCSAYTPLHFTGSQVAITYRSSRLYTSWIYLLVQWLKPSSTQKVIMAQLKVILSRALAMTTNMVFYTDLKKKRQEQGAERHQERSGYQFDLWVPLRALCSQAVLLHTSILSHMGTTWSAHTSWL